MNTKSWDLSTTRGYKGSSIIMEQNSECFTGKNQNCNPKDNSYRTDKDMITGAGGGRSRMPNLPQLSSGLATVASESLIGEQNEEVSLGSKFNSSWLKSANQEIKSKRSFSKQKYFLICRSCFWCASYFKSHVSFASCPSCHQEKIDCMPIFGVEQHSHSFKDIAEVAELNFSKGIVGLR